MNVKHTISALTASLLVAGATAAVADDNGKKNKRNQDRATASAATFGQGTAEASRRGARADAVVGAQTESQRQGRRGGAVSGNASSTFGSGAIFTDRRTASGAVTTGGTASGQGEQNTSSDIEAYGSTDRTGSTAEVLGGSTARSGRKPN